MAENYLLALEFSPTTVSMIWLLPPTCGALLQPCFGLWSDNSLSRFGKRKPFIVGGGLCLSISLFTFAWSVELSYYSSRLMGSTSCSESGHICVMAKVLVIFSVLAINVSAQAIQAGARAIFVDLCPSHLQSEVNAWASRICNIASILLYLATSLNLPRWMPFLGDTQLKGLAAIASLILIITISITCLGVSESSSAHKNGRDGRCSIGPLYLLNQLSRLLRDMPVQLGNINRVQFFSWFAWYPYIVYISKYERSPILMSSTNYS